MRCKHCRYRLDGLADNRCPECGEAFDPNDRETFNDGGKLVRVPMMVIVLLALISYTGTTGVLLAAGPGPISTPGPGQPPPMFVERLRMSALLALGVSPVPCTLLILGTSLTLTIRDHYRRDRAWK